MLHTIIALTAAKKEGDTAGEALTAAGEYLAKVQEESPSLVLAATDEYFEAELTYHRLRIAAAQLEITHAMGQLESSYRRLADHQVAKKAQNDARLAADIAAGVEDD